MTKTLIWALVLAPALALAEPKTPDEWYKEGETRFNLADFDGAVVAFKKGFELESNESKRPAYLFNVALSYREGKHCKDAVFFFKRYLALKDRDKVKPLTEKKRADVDKMISALDDCVAQEEAAEKKAAEKPPEELPPAKPVVAAVTPEPHDDGGGVTKTAPAASPHVISVRAVGGAAKISTGSVAVSLQPSVGLFAGYPLALSDKLTLDLGGAVLVSPVPFDTAAGMTGSATMLSALADVALTLQLAPRVAVRADLGAGALVFNGVSESPFTDGKVTTGALTMPEVRAGLSADFAITPKLLATLAPIAFSYSPPKAGLRADITSITRLEFMIGLGYRM